MAEQPNPAHAAVAGAGGNEHARERIGVFAYFAVLAQLALLALVLRQFQIESAAFLRLALLAFVGFALHAWLPLAYRLPFFLMLSLIGTVLVLDVANGLWTIGIGLALIGICHLPFSFVVRGALLATVGAALIALRTKWLPGPVPEAIWPILGSMFMFRMIVYFYDLRHDRTATSPVRTLSYFFMLPNACFPLFPVIDFKTFRRNYFDDDAYRIYQVGVDWMVRGVIHLLLYRFIYLYLTLTPSEVTTPSTLIQYLVTNFLLYLRVSGLFHLIIGMLCLFGFRLPETHNRYLLASSFTDFWRRINIYWKDFMQKVFYYPALFKLRRIGTTRAMVVATLYVFVLTWLLHAYQWLWLRGTLLLVWQDVLFWTFLGLLVVVNALYELKYGRKRTLGATAQTRRDLLILVAKRFVTFWCICILWSFWTTDSIADWLSLWSALDGALSIEVFLYPAVVLIVIFVGSIERTSLRNTRSSAQDSRALLRTRLVTVMTLIVAGVIGIEAVHTQLGSEVASTVHSLRSARLSRIDNAKLERGYYENLLSVDRFNSQLWEVYAKKPASWLDISGANLKRFTGDFVQTELIPGFVANSNYGAISINRWGMRDRDYERAPSPGVFRIAVVGSSTVMGWGVSDGETFESIVEGRLNREWGTSGGAYEILNFAVYGYQPPQQMVAVDRALTFKPNALFYVATGREPSNAVAYLIEVVQKRIEIPFEPLRDMVRTAGLRPGMDETAARKLLNPLRGAILAEIYSHIARRARAQGVVPVLVFLPQAVEGSWQEETPETMRIAEAAGFVIVDLGDVYRNHDVASYRVAEWDHHPNPFGHQLIAARLFDLLQINRQAIFSAGGAAR